jgi:lysophospholipase L1-like esterase|tara:strand:+ start:40 stop:819 length:780 start_codon:yes stop_codon:yes gene_type:complete
MFVPLFIAFHQTLAADIIIFGDSWASEGAAPFAKMLKDKGSALTSFGVGVSGTTAADWAKQPNAMRDAVRSHGGDAVKYVWLTICGNDAKDTLPLCLEGKDKCIAKVVAQCTADALKFVAPALAAYPNLRVVQFGYDILGFGKNLVCEALAVALIPGCAGNTTCFNSEFIKLQSDYVDKFAAALPSGLGSRFDAVRLLGTLQASEHVGAASIGRPDLAKFSPNDLMQENCIHPTTQKGFGVVFDALYDLYFANRTVSSG